MPERSDAEAGRLHRANLDKGLSDTNKDRRRSPRFNCAGLAKISSLPSNGIFLPGSISDLSLGGCAIDTSPLINFGTRAELVVHVNSSSFRVVGEVKQLRRRTGAGFEFMQLSAAGKDCLANMINDLARLQAAMKKMRSSPPDTDLESLKNGLGGADLLGVIFNKRVALSGMILPATAANDLGSEAPEFEAASQNKDRAAEPQRLVISVDLFV
jgi:hypothetical protein